MQSGQIIRRGSSWLVRYWKNEGVDADGKVIRRRVAERLAPYAGEKRTDKRLRELAEKIVAPVNDERDADDSLMTVQQFIELRYLPWAKEKKRPSTYKGYNEIFQGHIKGKTSGVRLSAFRTVDGQRLLDDLAEKKKLARRTLFHIKSFLSGVFSFARRTGALDGPNPLQGRGAIEVGGHTNTAATYAYTLEEILTMLDALTDEMHITMVTVAAFTGLSLSELRGLRWQDIGKNEINVENTFWRDEEGTTKTKARKAPVPLLDVVSEALAKHREANPRTTYVFESPATGKPFDIATIGSKRIKSALVGKKVQWAGWHSFRRGLGTNLYELGVPDLTIQGILRHSNVATTQTYYIKKREAAGVEAMKRLQKKIRQRSSRTIGKKRR
jgi:integrase